MKTLEEIKATILAANPEQTYSFNGEEIPLTEAEFQDSINKRAEMEYEQQIKAKEIADAKGLALGKLEALGLDIEDLQALGLGGN